jgi:hypothetical protein
MPTTTTRTRTTKQSLEPVELRSRLKITQHYAMTQPCTFSGMPMHAYVDIHTYKFLDNDRNTYV